MCSRIANNKNANPNNRITASWPFHALKLAPNTVFLLLITLFSACSISPDSLKSDNKSVEALNWQTIFDANSHPAHGYAPGVDLPSIDPISQRVAAFSQSHRTPRTKPPAHNFLTKPVKTGRLTSGHGFRISRNGKVRRYHNGIDYAAPVGTPVYAAGEGIVELHYRSKSYGNYIRIRHDNGFSTAYAHLHSFSEGLLKGNKVERGEVIGYVGSTGRSTGPHLHFEVIYKGKSLNPLLQQPSTEQASGFQKPNSG